MEIDLSNRVAIVTGAGRGLGAAHAVELASRGAKIVVTDLDAQAAADVRNTIQTSGGEALAVQVDVTKINEIEALRDAIVDRWGRVDILVNNAGILRDKSFAKMSLEDFRLVLEVHLMGSVNCTKALWPTMVAQRYGRVIFTTSSSGLYGNFGQSNYAAAKMALVGLMRTLSLEGERHNIRVNCLAPSAATDMTNALYAPEILAGIDPALVSPAVVALASEASPTQTILLAGAGSFEQAHITMTRGLFLGAGAGVADELLGRLSELGDLDQMRLPARGEEQYQYEMSALMKARTARSA